MEKPVTLPAFESLPSAQDIVQITHWLQQAGLSALELTNTQGLHLRLVAAPSLQSTNAPHCAQPVQAPQVEAALTPVTTPYFGHLRLQDTATQQVFAPVGQTVQAGETVAVLDLGTITVAVHAPCAGVVANSLAQDGDLVGYGQTILSITPS